MSALIGKTGAGLPARVDRRNSEARDNQWRLEVDRAMLALARHAPDDPAMQERPAPTGPRGPLADARRAGTSDAHIGDDAEATMTGDAQTGPDHAAPATTDVGSRASVSQLVVACAGIGTAMAGRKTGGLPGRAADRSQVNSLLPHSRPSAVALPAAAMHSHPVTAAGIAATTPNGDAPLSCPEQAEGSAGQQVLARQAQRAGGGQGGETYADRHAHVLVDEAGVHAYLRDAQLAPDHIAAIARAVYAEGMLGEGRLATVTVNGRSIQRPASFDRAAVPDGATPLTSFERGEMRHDDQRR